MRPLAQRRYPPRLVRRRGTVQRRSWRRTCRGDGAQRASCGECRRKHRRVIGAVVGAAAREQSRRRPQSSPRRSTLRRGASRHLRRASGARPRDARPWRARSLAVLAARPAGVADAAQAASVAVGGAWSGDRAQLARRGARRSRSSTNMLLRAPAARRSGLAFVDEFASSCANAHGRRRRAHAFIAAGRRGSRRRCAGAFAFAPSRPVTHRSRTEARATLRASVENEARRRSFVPSSVRDPFLAASRRRYLRRARAGRIGAAAAVETRAGVA